MKKSIAVVLALASLLLAAIPVPSQAGGNPESPIYDADSWKTVIPASCRSYFDGCNNCRRAEGSEIAACTRKACATYEKPRCLDQPITEGSVGKTPFDGKLVRFECGDGNMLRIYHDEYVSGDQRVRLAEDELMLVDEQARTAYRLERVRAASGAKYANDTLEFWEHGGEAMLRKDGEKIYGTCRIAG